MIVAVGVLAVFPRLLAAQSTDSLPRDKVANLCWPELAKGGKYSQIGPIPVGCELVDCCPGCTRPDALSWRIHLSGGPVASAGLEFDDLPPGAVAGLTAQGAATPLEGGKFRIGKGASVISGLPGTAVDKPPVGRLLLAYDSHWGEEQLRDAAKQETITRADDADAVELVVEQLLGDVVVNEYLLRYNLHFCAPHESDKIVLSSNSGNDAAVVRLLATERPSIFSSRCVEKLAAGNSGVPVGKLTTTRACPSEVAVFSVGDQMTLLAPPEPAWTKNDDVLEVELLDHITVPVTIWLVRNDGTAQGDADDHLSRAIFLYDTQKTGITFTAEFRPPPAIPNAHNIISTDCEPDSNAATTGVKGVLATADDGESQQLFFPKKLNVYYVANSSLSGRTCFDDRNVIYVGTDDNSETLAHEFGHSMGLWHTNGLGSSGFGGNNLMWSQSSGRANITEGQVFRLNVHCASTLNLNLTRNEDDIRRCDHTMPQNPQPAVANCNAHPNTSCPPLPLGIDLEPD